MASMVWESGTSGIESCRDQRRSDSKNGCSRKRGVGCCIQTSTIRMLEDRSPVSGLWIGCPLQQTMPIVSAMSQSRDGRILPASRTPSCLLPDASPRSAVMRARRQDLVLRNANEAGWCLGGSAPGALADSERTFGQLTLQPGLCAFLEWGGLQRLEVAGHEAEQRP